MFKILDKRNGEVTAEQQAVFNKISTNNADGYVDGFLNSLRIAKMSSNVISIDSGLLSIQGFRSVNDTLTTYTVSVTPSEPIPFQLVATYSHYISDENDTLEITTRPTQELRREPLFSGQNAVYEVELAEFNMTADGIADFNVTLEKIVYNEQDLSELLDKVAKAEQDSATALEKVNELETQVIEKQGTAVYVGGEAQSRVNFTSDPQTQITANKNAIAEAQSDINNIIDGSQTVGKATQDAKGNVIDTTYAKLSQVVTKDNSTNVINATTDAAKYFLRNKQVLTSAVAINATGWYRIAKLPTYSSSRITVMKQYNYGRGISLILDVAVGADNTEDATTNIVASYAGMRGQSNYIDKVRYKHAGSGQVYIDVHIISDGNVNSYWLAYDGANAYTTFTSSEFALYQFQQTSDTGGTELPMPEDTGLATSGTIYQQGAPVFATDPTKLAPSTANGWTQTTKTGTLPGAGVYMVVPNASMGTLGIGVMFYGANEISVSAIGAPSGAVSLYYAPSGDTKWALYGANGTQIQLTDIHYKRIA